MPDFQGIATEIQGIRFPSPSDIVRKKYTEALFNLTSRNVILYYSAWQQKPGLPTGIDDFDMNGFMSVIHGLDKTIGVDLILHTPGGNLAATEAIGEYLKKTFCNNIRVFVPHLAMSGGTLLSFMATEIFMGTHSSLGPIDPLFDGKPAHGVIDEFQRAIDDVKNDPVTIEVWKHIIAQYSPTFIGECRNAMAWSDEIATRWLKESMFSSSPAKDRDKKIEKIVKYFGDHIETKSHGRHFMADQCKKLGLNVTFLEDKKDLQDIVLSIHHACVYAMSGPQIVKMIENHLGKTHAMVKQIDNK